MHVNSFVWILNIPVIYPDEDRNGDRNVLVSYSTLYRHFTYVIFWSCCV